jgi:hypothetical protein
MKSSGVPGRWLDRQATASSSRRGRVADVATKRPVKADETRSDTASVGKEHDSAHHRAACTEGVLNLDRHQSLSRSRSEVETLRCS